MITENIVINHQYSWIDIHKPLRADFDFLKKEYMISPLLIQDCLRLEHLPKYEETPEGHFILFRSFDESCPDPDVNLDLLTRTVGIFITPERIHTIHQKEIPFLSKLEEAYQVNAPQELQNVLYAVVKGVVLTFEESVAHMQRSYVEFEDEVLSRNNDQLSLNRVYQFRRKIFLIKSLLKKTQAALIQGKNIWSASPELLQDLREEIDQLYFRLDDISHNFDQLFSLHLSINDRKVNEVMKVLTIFSTILLPLTFVASFYGMNFTKLPGLETTSGLVSVTVLMVMMVLGTMWYFKSRGWFFKASDQ